MNTRKIRIKSQLRINRVRFNRVQPVALKDREANGIVRASSDQSESESECEKIKEQVEKIKDKADKEQRKFSLSLSLSLGLNRA